jgi:hypothetical protein
VEEVVEEIVEKAVEEIIEEEITIPEISEQIEELEEVDLSQQIVIDPKIDEEVYLKPENIPEDIRNVVFIDEPSSVPVTEEEVLKLDDLIAERTEVVEIDPPIAPETELVEEIKPSEEIVEQEPSIEVGIPEAEQPIETIEQIEQIEETVEVDREDQEVRLDGLSDTQIQRRNEIIQQMLAETRKREEFEEIQKRDLGKTEGKVYSAVVFGQESNRNVKKWRKMEKARLRREKKEARRRKKKRKKE